MYVFNMDFCNISTLGKRGYAFFFPFEPLPDVLLDMLPPLRVSAMTIPTSATDCVGDGVWNNLLFNTGSVCSST